jgi:ADP-ribosyl-[dinitrogen reductase] hydrolase
MTTPATLTGLAVGDALGMPFETHHWTSEALLGWNGGFQSGATNERQPNLLPGQWTDDTKMALALAKSLAACETYDPVATVQNYMEWYFSNDHRGMGKTTNEALERINNGYHWLDSGISNAEGNGVAMRVAPLGLFYRNTPATAAIAARIDANITHRSREAAEGAVAVATAVALLTRSQGALNLDSMSFDHFIRKVVYYLNGDSKVEEKLVDVIDHLDDLSQDPDIRLKSILMKLIDMGTGAHVVQTVPAAFLCFLATSNFADAVDLAIRAGGDTDTTAAITGALAGTFYGIDQVQPYLEQLEASEAIRQIEQHLYDNAPEYK